MPPSTLSTWTIYGATLAIDFEPQVIVCAANVTLHSYYSASVKINGMWQTIYKPSTSTQPILISDKYTVTDNGDGTYTIPMIIDTKTPQCAMRWFAIG